MPPGRRRKTRPGNELGDPPRSRRLGTGAGRAGARTPGPGAARGGLGELSGCGRDAAAPGAQGPVEGAMLGESRAGGIDDRRARNHRLAGGAVARLRHDGVGGDGEVGPGPVTRRHHVQVGHRTDRAAWNPTKWMPWSASRPSRSATQARLTVAADIEIDQLAARPQSEPLESRIAGPGRESRPSRPRSSARRPPCAGRARPGTAPSPGGRLAQVGDQAGRVAAEPAGVGGVDIGPGEVGEQEARDPRPPRGDQGAGGASQRMAAVPSSRSLRASSSTRSIASAWTLAARPSVASPSVAAVSPGGFNAPTSDTCTRVSPTSEAARASGEEVRMTPNRDRDLRRHPVDHRHRSVEMAESVAGHIDREPPHRPIAVLASEWGPTGLRDRGKSARITDRAGQARPSPSSRDLENRVSRVGGPGDSQDLDRRNR